MTVRRTAAEVVQLSPATRAVVSSTCVMFIRGDRVFTLDSREAKRIAEAITTNQKTEGNP